MSVKRAICGGVLAICAAVLVALYAFVRPIAVERLTPLLQEAAKERISGAVSWRALDLDSFFDLELKDIELRDTQGRRVFFAPQMTVGWTIAGALDALWSDDGVAAAIGSVRLSEPEINLRKAADGSWNVQHLLLSEEEGPTTFRGRVLLQDGKVSVSLPEGTTYTADAVSGQAVWGASGVIEATISGNAFGAKISGKLVYTDENRYYGKLETEPVALTALAPLVSEMASSADVRILGGTGTVTKAEIDCRGGLLKYDVRGTVTNADVLAAGYEIRNADADFDLTEKKLSLENGKASVEKEGVKTALAGKAEVTFGETLAVSVDGKSADGALSGEGFYTKETGEFSAKLTAKDLDASIWQSLGISGKISGNGTLAGRYHDGAISLSRVEGDFAASDAVYGEYSLAKAAGHAVYASGKSTILLEGEGISAKGIFVDTLSAELVGRESSWQCPYVFGTMGSGAFSARGRYDDGQFDIRGEAAGISLENISTLIGRDIGGTLSLEGRVSGTAEAPVYEAALQLDDGHFENAPILHAEGAIHGNGDTLYIDRSTVTLSEGTHTLVGAIGLSGAKELNLKEKTEKSRLENVLKLAGIDVPLTGFFDNEMTITGTMENPTVSGTLLATDGSVAGELFQSIYADYTWKDGALSIGNGLGYLYGGTASATGTYADGKLDFDLAMVDVDMDRVLVSAPVEGYATFRGRLTGTINSPKFSGMAESREIRVKGKGFGRVSAEVSYEDGVFHIADGYFQERGGEFRYSGLANAKTGALSGQLKFRNWEMTDALALVDMSVKNVKGAMTGTLGIRGTLDNPDIDLNVTTSDAKLGHLSVAEGHLDMTYTNHVLSLRELSLPLGQGLLTASGTIQEDGAVSVKAAAKKLDLSVVPEIVDNVAPLGGLLTGDIDVRGNVRDPEASVSVTVDSPMYNDFIFNTLYLAGQVSQGTITVKQAILTKDIYKANAYGTLPAAALTRMPDGRNIPYDLTLNLENADLNALVLFSKQIRSAKGPIDGKLHVTGAWDDPEIRGDITVTDGEMTVAGMVESLSPVSGKMSFTGKEATLEAKIAAHKNEAGLQGRIAWDKQQLTDYEGNLQIRADSIRSDYYTGALSADLSLAKENQFPKISGKITAEDATVTVPLSFEEGGETPDVLMDITVSVGDNVRLLNSLLFDLYAHGNIHAMGLASRPLMSGKLDVTRGVIKYLTHNFNISEGTAVFGAVSDSFLPVMTLKGETQVDTYKIRMDLKGPVGKFVLKLSSEPALNDTQIVSLLTFGRDSVKGGFGDTDSRTGALFNAGLQMVFNGSVQNFLQNSFGLDLFNVTTSMDTLFDSKSGSTDDEYYYLKVGKYLFHDFMLMATMGVNNSEKAFGFRYDLRSRFGVTAWYNTESKEYVGVEYQFKF